MDNFIELVVIGIIIIVVILIAVLVVITLREKAQKNEGKKKEKVDDELEEKKAQKSIFKFMEFDTIEDNMIVQDGGKRYLMVIECEGVNYDLMSQVEKTAVEAGFVQFLNTLRYPIQLYTQTRSVNIEDSIQNYKNKLDETKKDLEFKQRQYNMFIKIDDYDESKAEELKRELIRVKNLYEYGQDIIENIQKTSQNKSVLRKHYYVVVPYYAAEIGTDLLNEEEKRNMIFSELYTRSQALIRALFSCEMKCRILNSNELVDLLYVSYNRDDSETYTTERAIQAGFSELYSTAPDVLDKRIRALDKKIQQEATELVTEAIDEVRLEKERKIKTREENFDELVSKMAETMLKDGEKFVGKETTEEAIKKVKSKTKGKGGEKNEQKAKRSTKRTADGQ